VGFQAVFEMWSHRGYSTSPVKSTAQRYTVVLAVLMSAYFLNPFIKTGPACTDFIESLVYVKRISIDLLTSVVCLFYGTEIYFIFSVFVVCIRLIALSFELVGRIPMLSMFQFGF
jgi:hypothetical protein